MKIRFEFKEYVDFVVSCVYVLSQPAMAILVFAMEWVCVKCVPKNTRLLLGTE